MLHQRQLVLAVIAVLLAAGGSPDEWCSREAAALAARMQGLRVGVQPFRSLMLGPVAAVQPAAKRNCLLKLALQRLLALFKMADGLLIQQRGERPRDRRSSLPPARWQIALCAVAARFPDSPAAAASWLCGDRHSSWISRQFSGMAGSASVSSPPEACRASVSGY